MKSFYSRNKKTLVHYIDIDMYINHVKCVSEIVSIKNNIYLTKFSLHFKNFIKILKSATNKIIKNNFQAIPQQSPKL